MTKSAAEIYAEIYGTKPLTRNAEFKDFCLALWLCSKTRNKNASDKTKERIKKKNPAVMPHIEWIMHHAKSKRTA